MVRRMYGGFSAVHRRGDSGDWSLLSVEPVYAVRRGQGVEVPLSATNNWRGASASPVGAADDVAKHGVNKRVAA